MNIIAWDVVLRLIEPVERVIINTKTFVKHRMRAVGDVGRVGGKWRFRFTYHYSEPFFACV